MPRYVAFLRAINVGGHTVKMDRLKAIFEDTRLAGVETFIASGNVLFDTTSKDLDALERKIEKKLETALGYEVTTFIRPLSALAGIADSHPFRGYKDRGHTLSVGFLKAPVKAGALAAIATDTDEFHLHDREAYWLAHTGMGNSRVSPAALQKALGGPATFRNVNTVQRLAAKV